MKRCVGAGQTDAAFLTRETNGGVIGILTVKELAPPHSSLLGQRLSLS
jgi:hypothetical protein